MYAWFKKQRISIYGKGNMTQITATVQAREDKKPNQLRAAGILPANIYGEGKSVAVQLKQQDFVKLYNQAGESGLIYLTLEGDKEKHPVMIEEAQADSLSGKFVHVSFHQVSLKEKISAEIPVEIEGEFNVLGGVMVLVKDTVEVEALPTDLPEKFVFLAENLKEIGQTITYKDLSFDRSKVSLVLGEEGEDEPLIIVQEQKAEVEEVAEVVEEGTEGSEAASTEDKPAEETATE
ncbi:MAG: 50S ribosomal protein L25 [Candidatus Pacebacteria bacterium CG10_big_fil_rev_8_21_14_0_10_36_11]|nr:MAG: hypothetical protein AUK08_04980 [Candidatus Pacebacteria bacterium CG2_30_36_39]PIR64556.1 MAG: 50S ribosomal protein L25 [Candidatus Pacebacteria bacterium CG10_big_fil_rev_8_21_14_0_10_36_11]PJC42690.1 MAG: 50S ribosomal protein L25 [Candidatus Pacebacteria bacterium CG_4_9_14_0_2_um_filter_36_8]